MHRDILEALSTGWIEEALGVSRAAVSDWRRGKFPERRRAQLEEAVRAVLAATEEAPPPWVTGLPAEVANEVVSRLVDRLPEVLDQQLAAIRRLNEGLRSEPDNEQGRDDGDHEDRQAG